MFFFPLSLLIINLLQMSVQIRSVAFGHETWPRVDDSSRRVEQRSRHAFSHSWSVSPCRSTNCVESLSCFWRTSTGKIVRGRLCNARARAPGYIARDNWVIISGLKTCALLLRAPAASEKSAFPNWEVKWLWNNANTQLGERGRNSPRRIRRLYEACRWTS